MHVYRLTDFTTRWDQCIFQDFEFGDGGVNRVWGINVY